MKTKSSISKLNITWFDLETTGLDIKTANPVSIYAVNSKLKYTINSLVNPGIVISDDLTAIHGINDLMVKDKPSFIELANSLISLFSRSEYIAGYNICKYDVPLIQSLFNRNSIDFNFSKFKFIDLFYITKNVLNEVDLNTPESLKLSAVYKLVTGEELCAHNAFNDVIACIKILEIFEEHGLNWRDYILDYFDLTGSIISDVNWKFKSGKHQGKELDWVINNDKNYLTWMIKNDKLKLEQTLLDKLKT